MPAKLRGPEEHPRLPIMVRWVSCGHFHSQRCSHPLSLAKAWQLQGGSSRSSSPGCPAGWLPTEAFITFSAPREPQSNTLYYPWATSKPPAGTDPETEQLATPCQFLGGGEEVSNVSGQGDGATHGAAGRARRGAGHGEVRPELGSHAWTQEGARSKTGLCMHGYKPGNPLNPL